MYSSLSSSVVVRVVKDDDGMALLRLVRVGMRLMQDEQRTERPWLGPDGYRSLRVLSRSFTFYRKFIKYSRKNSGPSLFTPQPQSESCAVFNTSTTFSCK